MSDQIMFTEGEVEKIKTVLHKHELTDNGHYWNDIKDALSILDSPRPRPKVSQKMLYIIAKNGYVPGSGDELLINTIANNFGFDVED